MTTPRYIGPEAEYTGPVIDGLGKLNMRLPASVLASLRVREAVEQRLTEARAVTGTHSMSMRQQLADEALEAIRSKRAVPPLAEKIVSALHDEQVRGIELAALEQALQQATEAIPRTVAASAPAIEAALSKKLPAILTEVREVAPIGSRMPLSDPVRAARDANEEQLQALAVVSRGARDHGTIRDLQARLRVAQNARDADRAIAEYEDPAEARQAPRDALERIVWLATVATPVVRGPRQIAEYEAAKKPGASDPRLRRVEVERLGSQRKSPQAAA